MRKVAAKPRHRLRPKYKIFRRCKKCAPVVYEGAFASCAEKWREERGRKMERGESESEIVAEGGWWALVRPLARVPAAYFLNVSFPGSE